MEVTTLKNVHVSNNAERAVELHVHLFKLKHLCFKDIGYTLCFCAFAFCRQRLYAGFYMKTLKEDQKRKTLKLVTSLVVFVAKLTLK